MRAWVLTDGASDDEAMCLGVAEAVCDRVERRRVFSRAPWRWFARFGSVDPREAVRVGSRHGLDVRRPWPEIAIAAGASAAPYLDHVKRASQGATTTVLLGAGAGAPDLRWTLDRDASGRGANVIATPAPPHRVNAVRLAAARGGPPVFAAPGARVGVLVGDGPARFGAEDVARLVAGLKRLREQGAILVARLGPRAPEALAMALSETAHYLWDRTSPDPYLPVLAQSEALVVSADQERVIAEAVSTGRPVMTFQPAGSPRRAQRLVGRLTELGVVRPFTGRLETYAYAPLDSTIEIAHAIHALVATRAALRPASTRKTAARQRETNGPDPR